MGYDDPKQKLPTGVDANTSPPVGPVGWIPNDSFDLDGSLGVRVPLPGRTGERDRSVADHRRISTTVSL
jgi:hypothetical protein